MLVCHCRALSDREIRHVIHRGARTFAQVAAACGAGTQCGGCRPVLDEILQGAEANASAAEAADAGLLVAAAAA